jgi:hypothetical protein
VLAQYDPAGQLMPATVGNPAESPLMLQNTDALGHPVGVAIALEGHEKPEVQGLGADEPVGQYEPGRQTFHDGVLEFDPVGQK